MAEYGKQRHRAGKLDSCDTVLWEIRRVYRAVRNHDMPMDEAKGLTYILSVISAMIKTGDLESRLDELEEHLARGNNITTMPITREVKNGKRKTNPTLFS